MTSLEAVQERLIWVDEITVGLGAAGTVGAVVSAGPVVDALSATMFPS